MSLERSTRRQKHSERERTPQTLVVYAGESERRAKFIEWAFRDPQFIVTNRPGGRENEAHGVVAIVQHKLAVALATVINEGIVDAADKPIIIAADVKTRVGTSRISRSKPKDYDEARRMLEFMSRHAYPYFTVEAGSGIQIGNSKPNKTSSEIAILLDRDVIGRLATPEGFEVYMKGIQTYDTLPSGGSNDITEISGGLSLPALIQSNAVREIHFENGTSEDSSVSHESVKRALCHTSVGFSPDLLRKVQPNIDEKIATWPWFETTATRCLSETA